MKYAHKLKGPGQDFDRATAGLKSARMEMASLSVISIPGSRYQRVFAQAVIIWFH
jgi:hypothetical protein